MYTKLIHNTAMKYVRNHHDAEDVTQNVLMLLHNASTEYKGLRGAKFTSWLHTVIANASLTFLRDKRRKKRFAFTVDLNEFNDAVGLYGSHDPRLAIEAKDTLFKIADFIDSLTPKYKEVFWKRYYDGMSEPEIAKETGASVAAVKSRLHHLRNKVAGLTC